MELAILRFIIALAGALYLWFGAPQFKIGYPGFYWEQGFLPFLGFIAVVISIMLTMISTFCLASADPVIATSESSKREDIEGLMVMFHLFGIVSLILLLILPEPPHGIQLLPSRHASYVSPLATKMWVFCWSTLGLVALAYFVGSLQTASGCLILVFSTGLLLNFFTTKDQPLASMQPVIGKSSAPLKSASMTQEQDAKAILVTSKRKREKMSETLRQLQSQNRELVLTFGSTKTNSRSSSRERMEMQLDAERQELASQILQLESDLERLNETILSMESAIRRKERQRLVSDQGVLDDADYEALLQKFLLLDADLSGGH